LESTTLIRDIVFGTVVGQFQAQIHTKELMNICSSQDKISVKLLVAAATDEILVGAAKLGIAPRLRGCGSDNAHDDIHWRQQ
jgi:hypothetical protein